MFRYYDVMEFAIGQNDLKDLLCGILGSENGLSTYNALDLLTFLASLQMIMTGIVISQSQANNANNIAQKAAYQNPEDEGGKESTGKLTGSLDGLTPEERAVVNELLDAGNDVEIIPRSNIPNCKTPDFYVNGVKTELKTLFGSSLNTPVTRIQEGFAQGAVNVIIDARKTGMTLEEAIKVIERVLGIFNDELPGTVEIWTIEGILRR